MDGRHRTRSDLARSGLDEGPNHGPHGPYHQSLCRGLYDSAVDRLREHGLVYPCYCTRKELRVLAGAPHGGRPTVSAMRARPIPETCRHLTAEERAGKEAEGRRPSLRLLCPDDDVEVFDDLVLGRQEISLKSCGGDFALRRSDGVWAYQLAVVVDDMRMGVTQVVRGEDILLSHAASASALSPARGHASGLCAYSAALRRAGRTPCQAPRQPEPRRPARTGDCSPQAIVGEFARIAGLQETSAPHVSETPCRQNHARRPLPLAQPAPRPHRRPRERPAALEIGWRGRGAARSTGAPPRTPPGEIIPPGPPDSASGFAVRRGIPAFTAHRL